MHSHPAVVTGPDTAHGLVVTASGARSSWIPMMTARPAFADSARWFPGNPTAPGMHAGTISFTTDTPGTYRSAGSPDSPRKA